MKIGTTAKILIVFGFVLMFIAIKMSVSLPDSNIVNFGLMSERQNKLIVGGVFFIGGIILYALFKNKESNDEAVKNKIKSELVKE